LFYLPEISIQFLNKLESLLSLKEEENNNFNSLKLTLKDIQKKSNKRLTQGIISNLPVYRSLEEDSEDSGSVSTVEPRYKHTIGDLICMLIREVCLCKGN
jgi:hypothetical protein